MTTLEKAARQALDALKNAQKVRAGEGGTKHQTPLENAAITVLEDALAQQAEPVAVQAEPVAWVGLTDEEIWACIPPVEDELDFARAIEVALKEKNAKQAEPVIDRAIRKCFLCGFEREDACEILNCGLRDWGKK